MRGLYYGMEYYSSWATFVLPALILAFFAQYKIKNTYNKFLRVSSGISSSGAEVARIILDRNGLNNVRINQVSGNLSDHYDPRNKTVNLSTDVYRGNSVASLSIAAHEVGHALQDAEEYAPLRIRSAIVPIANVGSRLVWPLIFIGVAVTPFFIELGIALFLAVILFQLVTLPVEFNASSRALAQLENGIITQDKVDGSKKVLRAAALTYVAAALVSVGELLRILSMTQNRRNNR